MSPAAQAQAGPTGTLAIGDDTTFTFRVSRCDLSGKSPDNLLLRGNGTSADGRSFYVEVERMAPPGGVGSSYERVTLVLPPAAGGNRRGSWEATRTLSGQGRWTSGPQSEPADGPLLQVSGAELVAEGTYHYELFLMPGGQLSADERRANRAIEEEARETRPGMLRATCAAPAAPES
jgi:hypothetical protein